MGKAIVSYTKDIFIDLKDVEFLDLNMQPFNTEGLTDKEIIDRYNDGDLIIKSLSQIENDSDDTDILSIYIHPNE